MDENRYNNILYLKKSSVCSTKSKVEESERETIKKSSGDLNNFNPGTPRHATAQKKEVSSNIIIDRKLQVCKFNFQTFQAIASIKLDFKTICAIALKFGLCLLDFVIEVFFNERVHNILAIIFTVTIEVFVVLVFAVSTILSAIIINIDEAYSKKPQFKNFKASLPKKPKDLADNECALKVKTDSVTKNNSSNTALVNSEKKSEGDAKMLKPKTPNLEKINPTVSTQSCEYKTVTISPTEINRSKISSK